MSSKLWRRASERQAPSSGSVSVVCRTGYRVCAASERTSKMSARALCCTSI
uniref:Uncharacterized protein n=1 Tax=Arundo donax TaxID=35708 RepID=A0A0A9E2I2_ARUDO